MRHPSEKSIQVYSSGPKSKVNMSPCCLFMHASVKESLFTMDNAINGIVLHITLTHAHTYTIINSRPYINMD